MDGFVRGLFSADGFMPRWYCGDWTDFHGWLYIASDIGVWSAYTAIPAVLIYFVWRNAKIPFKGVFLLFGAVHPGLRPDAFARCHHVLVAGLSTAWAGRVADGAGLLGDGDRVVPIVPRALSMRSPEELQREIDVRTQAELKLQNANHELEERIRQRTAELVAADATLYEQRELFRTTLASIGDAVIATDTTGHVTFFNPVAEALTGWSQAEAKGKPLTDVFRIINEMTRRPADNPAQYRRYGTEKSWGWPILRCWCRSQGVNCPSTIPPPIRDEQQRLVGVVLVFRDVTDAGRPNWLCASEEQLRRGPQQGRIPGDARSRVAQSTVGDTNLAGIVQNRGNAESIQWGQEVMQRQVEHIVRLVDDLLDLSRIMENKIHLRKEPVDLSVLATNLLAEVRTECDSHSQQLSLSLPAYPVWVEGDPVRLSQILANLLSNAIKYTDAGGSIRVDLKSDEQHATLTVSDTGVGIPANMLTQIFVPFTQIGNTLDRARGGLGIGLAPCASWSTCTAEASWRSEGAGQGSQFELQLPCVWSGRCAQAGLDAVGGACEARARGRRQSRRGKVPQPVAQPCLEARSADGVRWSDSNRGSARVSARGYFARYRPAGNGRL